MLILPHSIDLGLAKPPYVTYIVIALCLIIHYFQDQNRWEVNAAAESYCEAIQDSSTELHTADPLKRSKGDCQAILETMHSVPDKEWVIQLIEEWYKETYDLSGENVNRILSAVREHYIKFSAQTPPSLDVKLEYDPSTPNPVKAITSALSHADWWHVIGNLIFFCAFAPAVEILLGSAIQYIGIMVVITAVTSVTYSISTVINGMPIPTLGLSGVVMGMIGLSAYLTPHAKIKTFVWFLYFARNVYIPAWILAAWYIGWDTFDLFTRSDNGGVNLVAHVSGGIAGYLIGVYWLKDRREELREELSEEIEYRRSLRADKLGILRSDKSGQQRIANQWREHYAKEEHSQFVDRVYRLIKAGRDSEAVLLMLEDYELFHQSVEIYESLFWEMKNMVHRRAMHCLGRLNITELLKQKKYARAIAIAGTCLEASKDFVLADPSEVLVLANMAHKQNHYRLACALLENAESRYGTALDMRLYEQLRAELGTVT